MPKNNKTEILFISIETKHLPIVDKKITLKKFEPFIIWKKSYFVKLLECVLS